MARWHERWLSAAELWIYELNERQHWIFGLYDQANELWARLRFRGVKQRALVIDAAIPSESGEVRLRLLTPDDDEAFAALLADLAEFRYKPPHPLDRESAAKALRRASYLPFGVFVDGELMGYLLVRLFFPRRAVTAIWSRAVAHNRRFSVNSGVVTSAFTASEGFDDYITVPLDNPYSLKAAIGAGWDVVRTNRRFHVLRHARRSKRAAAAETPARD